jgi:hypothetical protein
MNPADRIPAAPTDRHGLSRYGWPKRRAKERRRNHMRHATARRNRRRTA